MTRVMRSAISWIYVLFCVGAVLVYGKNVGSVVILLSAVLTLPVEPVTDLWDNVPVVFPKVLVIATLFVLGVLLVP